MPLNIRAKPTQSRLPSASKGHHEGGSSHSRFSRSPKQGKGKDAPSSTLGSRSGLEPGSVSGGGPPPASKSAARQGPSSKPGSKMKPRIAAGDPRRATSSVTDPGGKTFSMENIQSLSAAYATSGIMYPSDRVALEPSGEYPKGTMTLGRTTPRSSCTGRPTTMGSSPNIASSVPPQSSDSYRNQNHHLPAAGSSSLRRQPVVHQQGQDCAGHGEGSTLDLQAQLRELQKENERLRREMEGGRDGRMKSCVNFGSPEVKRDRGVRREDGMKSSVQKDQSRADHEDCQHLPLTVEELQEELQAHRQMNSCLQQQQQSHYKDFHVEQDYRGDVSPCHSPRQSPGLASTSIHSPGPRHSPRASPSNTYNPRSQQQADVLVHSPRYCMNAEGTTQRLSPANTLHPGPRGGPGQHHYSAGAPTSQAPGPCPGTGPHRARSPCQVPGCDGFSSPPPPTDPAEDGGVRRLQTEHERKAKELRLLRKTMEEMETRLEAQKKTLGARDESIQRLLEMLQGQGPHGGRATKASVVTVATRDAEAQLEHMHVRETTNPPFCFDPDVIWQDTKISSLERNIRDLEDEVQMLKTGGGLAHPADDRRDELKQVEVYKSHSQFMKSKIDQLKQELIKKESEMQAVQTKMETLTNQNSDSKQHIDVLKESLNAKEQRANTLQTEVDALRVRLEEKEQILTKKSKQLQNVTDEKSTLTGEIRDMKDMLEVKERKVTVLQKKIENLLEQLKDKDKQLAGLRERVKGLQTDSSNTDTALATLEEALSEKERVIENLRAQKEREDRARQDDLELMRRENQALKDRLLAQQPQNLSQSQATDIGHTPGQRPEGEAPAKTEGNQAVDPKTQVIDDTSWKCPDIVDRLRLLEQEVARYREESGKSQAEVERLMGALRDAEVDRPNRDTNSSELERQIKTSNIQKQTVPTEMKREGLADGHPHSLSQPPPLASQNAMRETAERISELEQALKENMNTSAHREVLWAQEEVANTQAQRELEELMGALEKTRHELDATKVRLSSTQLTLHERDDHLHVLRHERRKQLEEILEMKQQALLASISEKDANIALLELSSSKRKKAQEDVMALKREKDRLMHQLKQQTQSRMKLIADNYEEDHLRPHPPPHHAHPHHPHHPHHPQHPQHPHHPHPAHAHHRSLPRGPPHANHRPPVDQDDEEGIWA